VNRFLSKTGGAVDCLKSSEQMISLVEKSEKSDAELIG
jgi:hypothetical protein